MSQENRNTTTETLLNKAIKTVKNYEAQLNATASAEKVDYHVYYLLGEEGDNILDYQSVTVHMLAALAKQEIATKLQNALGDYTYDNLISLLSELHTFYRMMDLENFRSHFLAYQLETFPNDFDDDRLKNIITRYTIKTSGIDSKERMRAIIEAS